MIWLLILLALGAATAVAWAVLARDDTRYDQALHIPHQRDGRHPPRWAR
ncbi:hypothetical protein [Streptomyces sp. NPDC014806]